MRLLTLEVLGQALAQCAAWRAAGTPTKVSVNVSVTNLLDLGFPDQVSLALDACGVPGDSLVLELTEDLLIADPARGRRVMSALVELGVGIVVDDYGTGYSSLSSLRDLPQVSGLKLDRSFVSRICEDPRSAAILESTVALSTALGLDLVGEGVESTDVRDRLAHAGCPVAQGYLFSRPAPAADIRLGAVASAVAGGRRRR